MRTWFITGANGFIGRNLAHHLLSNYPEDSLLLLDKEISSTNLPIYQKNILDVSDIHLISILRDVDFVVHLAAQTSVISSIDNPANDVHNNVIATLKLLAACKKVNRIKKFVFTSSAAVYGNTDKALSESIVPHPISPYGMNKLACEQYCKFFSMDKNVPTAVLRLTNVYGPNSYDKNSFLIKTVREIVSSQMSGITPVITINGDGSQTRDFLHVYDVSDAICQVAKNPIRYLLYQLGTGIETSVNDLVKILSEISTKRYGILPVVKHGPAIKGEILRSCSDTSLIACELGWYPSSNLREGIEGTFDYFESILFPEVA